MLFQMAVPQAARTQRPRQPPVSASDAGRAGAVSPAKRGLQSRSCDHGAVLQPQPLDLAAAAASGRRSRIRRGSRPIVEEVPLLLRRLPGEGQRGLRGAVGHGRRERGRP